MNILDTLINFLIIFTTESGKKLVFLKNMNLNLIIILFLKIGILLLKRIHLFPQIFGIFVIKLKISNFNEKHN